MKENTHIWFTRKKNVALWLYIQKHLNDPTTILVARSKKFSYMDHNQP